MATSAPELPVIADQTAFNLQRWDELCAEPLLQEVTGRIETDAYGHILMSPPPAPEHGETQFSIGALILRQLPGGKVITECPISTSDGVRLADVAWISQERREAQRGSSAFTQAPEICVEVLSPTNTRAEIDQKKQLYFEAGASEVWIRGLDGTMRFFLRDSPEELGTSALCPGFPDRV